MTSKEPCKRQMVSMPLAIISVWLATTVRPQEPVGTETFRTLQRKGQPFTLVDVRSPRDFQVEHIQGAINIPEPMLLKAKLPKDKDVVLYCGNAACQIGHIAAKTLAANGYKKVRVLEGGLAAWQSNSYPVEASKSEHVAKQTVIDRVSARNLKGEQDEDTVLILDVRPPTEFMAGHLSGAVNMSLEDLDSKSTVLVQEKQIVVYDRTARRSRQAAVQLQERGFKVAELNGGIPAWVAMGYPIEVSR